MMTNSDCTIYLYNKQTGGYSRNYVGEVYWNECKASNILKSGLQNADGLTVYLYSDDVVPGSPAMDILVKGNCPFEFNNTSAATVSASMKQLRSKYEFFTVSSVDTAMFGGLPHIEISAR